MFLMKRRKQRTTRTDTLLPDTTRFRSVQASRDAMRAELKAREGTTTEPKPEKAATRAVDGIVMYPSLSQKKQFRELLVETQSESRFQKARDGELPHFVVKTASRSEERRAGKECGSTCRSRW